MAGRALTVMLIMSLVVTMPCVRSLDDPNQVNWAKTVDNGIEAVTTLQFYVQDIFGGNNPTAVRVAQAPTTNSSPTLFGLVAMADDPLTEGPDPSSKLVGRAKGLYGSAGQTELGLIMDMNYGFLDGIYNGSSIIIVGLNAISQTVREMAVVGGTGVFRFARGYAIATTYIIETGDDIVGFNVTVITGLLPKIA